MFVWYCNIGMINTVSVHEVSSTVSKMKCERALGPDGVPVGTWKIRGNTELNGCLDCLVKLFRRVELQRN